MIDYFLQAPILYIINFILLIIYCIKVFFDPIFLVKSLKAIFYSVVETFKQMKSVKGVIAFLITYVTLSGAILFPIAYITNITVLYHIATTMIVFWSLPLITPLIPLTILLSMVITKYVFRDKNIELKKVYHKFIQEFKKG